MATTHHDTLARKFASLFDDPDAQEALAMLGARTRLPTFNLATSSLRHLPKWFDRLEKINNRQIESHGNFVSDPASIGLVDSSLIPLPKPSAIKPKLALRLHFNLPHPLPREAKLRADGFQ